MTIKQALNAEWRELRKSEDRHVIKPSMTAAMAKRILDYGERRAALVEKSKINPSLTRGQSLAILRKAVQHMDDAATIHWAIARNIAREFAAFADAPIFER